MLILAAAAAFVSVWDGHLVDCGWDGHPGGVSTISSSSPMGSLTQWKGENTNTNEISNTQQIQQGTQNKYNYKYTTHTITDLAYTMGEIQTQLK